MAGLSVQVESEVCLGYQEGLSAEMDQMFVAHHTHKQLSQGGSGTLTTEKEGKWGLLYP